MEARIDFARVLGIITKVSYFLEFKYGIPFDTGEALGVEALVNEKARYETILYSETLSLPQVESEIFLLVKDYTRANSECFQRMIDEDGNKKMLWFSPYFNSVVFDEIEEILGLVSTMADESTEDMKEMFYKHKHLFKLNDKEGLFIDLCFSGYNPQNEVDVLVFKEALETDSPKYVKTFFNRLCEKLKEKSIEIGLR